MSAHALAVTHSQLHYTHDALRLAFPSTVAREDRFVMTITAYFDESGTNADSDAVVVAGYLATPDAWEQFETEWREALDDWHLDFFHMSEFAHRINGYKHWTEEIRRERLNRLFGIINSHALGSVGTVVPRALYDAKFSFDGPARQKTGGPYGLAAYCDLMRTSELVRDLSGEPHVAYVFEKGAVGRDQFTKVFMDNLNDDESRARMRLLSLTFQDKRQFVPLQAADILAYELRLHLPRQLGTSKLAPRLHNLNALNSIPAAWAHINEPQMTDFAYMLTLAVEFSTGTWQLDHPPSNPRASRSRRRSTRDR